MPVGALPIAARKGANSAAASASASAGRNSVLSAAAPLCTACAAGGVFMSSAAHIKGRGGTAPADAMRLECGCITQQLMGTVLLPTVESSSAIQGLTQTWSHWKTPGPQPSDSCVTHTTWSGGRGPRVRWRLAGGPRSRRIGARSFISPEISLDDSLVGLSCGGGAQPGAGVLHTCSSIISQHHNDQAKHLC